MNNIITPVKLPRFQYIINNQTDRRRFLDKVLERWVGAEEIYVFDPTGLNYNYFPRFPAETKEQALSRRPVTIPKTKVDEYNQALLEQDPAPETPIDFDSVDVLIGQLTHWTETTILVSDEPYTEDDIIVILSGHGTPEHGKFIYSFTKDGKISDATQPKQQRMSNMRDDVQTLVDRIIDETKVVDNVLIVTSTTHSEVRKQIAELLNGNLEDLGVELAKGEVPLVFADDLVIPMTHLKDGQTYPADLATTALDFYGRVYFSVDKSQAPAPVLVVPTLTVASQFSRDEAVATGIPATWANAGLTPENVVVTWSTDVEDAVIEHIDPLDLTAAVIKLPDSVLVGDEVTITLTTDGGTVTATVTLIA